MTKRLFGSFIFLLIALLVHTNINTVKADNGNVDGARNAFIYDRTNRDHLAVYYVKDGEVPVYEYEDEEIYDFRAHFHIIDQRIDILKMKNIVDGANQPIDRGGYTWDFGTFDNTTIGKHTITITYVGANGVEISNSVDLNIIEEDVTPPAVFGYFPDHVDITGNFEDTINAITARDNVDGLIELTIDNFSGYESIKGSALNSVHEITMIVTDKAGNEFTSTFDVTVKDLEAPVIMNAENFETKINKPVDYRSFLSFSDNYTKEEDIVVEYFLVTDESGEDVIEQLVLGQKEIDFSKVGENYVKVVATDEGGESATKVFRVIVKDAPQLAEIILYINLIILGLASIIILTVVVTKKLRTRQ